MYPALAVNAKNCKRVNIRVYFFIMISCDVLFSSFFDFVRVSVQFYSLFSQNPTFSAYNSIHAQLVSAISEQEQRWLDWSIFKIEHSVLYSIEDITLTPGVTRKTLARIDFGRLMVEEKT